MYKIFVAEDEPTALNHVCMIIEKKCPQYEVMGTAENGQEALKSIRMEQPDVLLSDVKMPILDGILLAAKVKEEFPDILTVIISGYSEFEYAKGALQSGVCDYLLKPLAPSDMQKLMDKLEVKLNAMYYEKRNILLKSLCIGNTVEDKSVLYRYFQKGRYYAAIYRNNGLPKRFCRMAGVEIFSMKEEKVYIYGRDEMEALYLFPEELLFAGDFDSMAKRIFERERSGYTYQTSVIYEESFQLEEFPAIVKRLYRKLDESVVIGENQLLYLNNNSNIQQETGSGQLAERQLKKLEDYIRYKEDNKFIEELKKLFDVFEKQKYSQIYVEAVFRYLFQLLRNSYSREKEFTELEFMIDDAFYYASDMQELKVNILSIVKQLLPEMGQERIGNRERLFHSICLYIKANMEKPMTLGNICEQFGVSQTTLSKMFRTFEKTSFSNYLTTVRIEKAKEMMRQDSGAYIKDIAERVGYTDQFYFSRIFRSVAGICPKEYMENGLAGEQ